VKKRGVRSRSRHQPELSPRLSSLGELHDDVAAEKRLWAVSEESTGAVYPLG
jgi:hypothetical protein